MGGRNGTERLSHRGHRRVALGYVTSNGCARLHDTGVIDQVSALEGFCARRGWVLEALVHEVTPAKAKRGSRPALAYALERVAYSDISCLIVTELGHLCPSIAELRRVLEHVDHAGARLVSLNPAMDTGTEPGHMAMRVIAAVTELELARSAERSRAGLAAARARGAVEPSIEPTLRRRIVRMRAAGMTLQAIADDLNGTGVPTVRGGAVWRPSSIQAAVGYKRPARR